MRFNSAFKGLRSKKGKEEVTARNCLGKAE